MKKYFLIISIFIVFLIRLFLIINNHSYYIEKLNNKTNIYVYSTSAPRGRILDINGNVLVDNIGIKTIYYNKVKGISLKEELNIAKKLASIITIEDISREDLVSYYLLTHNNGEDLITKEEYELYDKRKLSSSEINNLKLSRITDDLIDYTEEEKQIAGIYALMNQGVVYSKKLIKSEVTEEEYAKVLEANIAGISGELSWQRVYPYGDTLRGIFGSIGSIPSEEVTDYLALGYSISDTVGVSYLEEEYEEYLKGEKAKYLVNSDYTLTQVSEEKRGNDLVLSIDINLQEKLESILKEKILLGQTYANTKYYKDSYALISDPNTGSILAMSAVRLNSDNTFSDISLNIFNTSFTIGSAVKAATIAVGYKYNLITLGYTLKDSCIKLAHVPKKCSFKSLGNVDDLHALAYSSNYYQYMIAIKLTNNEYTYNMKLNATESHFNTYRNMLASYGLGVNTGIDLPTEFSGIKGSIISDDLLLNLAIGQYDTYTPAQVLQYINSVATHYRYKLNLMKSIQDNEGNIVKEYESVILNKVDLADVYQERIIEGLKLVLSEGTGKIYLPYKLDFAGKTGTSESFLDTNNDNIVDVSTITSTFAGFYPSSNPKYSIVVITPNVSYKNENNDSFYYGASKITKDIIKYLIPEEET